MTFIPADQIQQLQVAAIIRIYPVAIKLFAVPSLLTVVRELLTEDYRIREL